MREINAAGVELIKQFEGCKLEAYYCPAGVLTIGIGHAIQPGEPFKKKITLQVAEDLLQADLAAARAHVVRLVKTKLTDNQFAALVSFTFNVGGGALQLSSLLVRLNGGDYTGASFEFVRWNKARVKGVLKPIEGLTRRRKAERDLFLTP